MKNLSILLPKEKHSGQFLYQMLGWYIKISQMMKAGLKEDHYVKMDAIL